MILAVTVLNIALNLLLYHPKNILKSLVYSVSKITHDTSYLTLSHDCTKYPGRYILQATVLHVTLELLYMNIFNIDLP